MGSEASAAIYTKQAMDRQIFICFITFCASFALTMAVVDYDPRKLVSGEIIEDKTLSINSLTSLPKKNRTQSSEQRIYKLKHVAKGTNKQKNWKLDAIRMPGTNWCGKGWRADDAGSMGGYAGADRCCRQHDLGCPISIEPGATQWGLTNQRIHTVMHCSCDERFRSCLKMARTQAADIVGNLFFNIADIPCFVFSKQVICTSRNWWGRCISEEEKMTAVWRKPLPYYN